MTLISVFIPKLQVPEILAFFLVALIYYINLRGLRSLLTEILSTSVKHLE
jgi:hypothetical protein